MQVEQLQRELARLQAELHRLEQITCKDMWLLDLDNFLEVRLSCRCIACRFTF